MEPEGVARAVYVPTSTGWGFNTKNAMYYVVSGAGVPFLVGTSICTEYLTCKWELVHVSAGLSWGIADEVFGEIKIQLTPRCGKVVFEGLKNELEPQVRLADI